METFLNKTYNYRDVKIMASRLFVVLHYCVGVALIISLKTDLLSLNSCEPRFGYDEPSQT